MIANIYIKQRVAIIDIKHNVGVIRKYGVLVMENMLGQQRVIDLASMVDITDNKDIVVKDTKFTTSKYLFQNTESKKLVKKRGR